MVQILKYFVKSVLISGPVVNEFSKKYSPYNMDHLYELYRIVSTQGSKLVERNADQLCSPWIPHAKYDIDTDFCHDKHLFEFINYLSD